AKVKKWRVPGAEPVAGGGASATPDEASLAEQGADFAPRARPDAEGIPERSPGATLADGPYVDAPRAPPTVRAHCDAIEIARYLLGDVPDQLSAEQHVQRLLTLQDPDSGMIAAFDAHGQSTAPVRDVHDDQANYHVLCVGYALDLLGSRLTYPIRAVAELGAEELIAKLDAQPWQGSPWRSGHFVDMVGTSLLWNRRHQEPSAG